MNKFVRKMPPSVLGQSVFTPLLSINSKNKPDFFFLSEKFLCLFFLQLWHCSDFYQLELESEKEGNLSKRNPPKYFFSLGCECGLFKRML